MKPAILIIDDEVRLAHSLMKLLSKDYDVFCALNGPNGLDVLTQEKIDLVLLDYILPGINGIDVLKKIKLSSPELAVIIMTGQGTKDLVLAAWQESADFYIDKPFDFEALQKSIAHLIDRNQIDPILKIDITILSITVRSAVKVICEAPHQFTTVKDIAQNISINSDYLSHLFKDETGMKLSLYLTIHKINKARELLKERKYSVKEVGYDLGFGSLDAFYRNFKNICGISPSEYRQRYL